MFELECMECKTKEGYGNSTLDSQPYADFIRKHYRCQVPPTSRFILRCLGTNNDDYSESIGGLYGVDDMVSQVKDAIKLHEFERHNIRPKPPQQP